MCPTLCDPMNRSIPGLPVHHQLPEFTQTNAHQVGDAIQPSHPLSSPPLALFVISCLSISTPLGCCFPFPCLLSVQFSSVTQSCPTLCDPMNCSTPGLPVHNQFPESTQTHAHRVGDAIQPSHPLLPPSPPAPNPSKHQGLFQ